MYKIGQEEIDAVAEVIRTGKLFRYGIGNACETFEKRYAEYLGVKHVMLNTSGTVSLHAALAGLKIGPGDEVLVPACTYIATAIAVLAVGAIPVVVDIDDSLTLDPKAVEAAIGPHTKAIIPVHMWGLVCDMDALMAVAKKHNLLVIEDACQCVGGAYKGRMCGSIGDVGAFSFNYYKNMSAGEGGATVTNNDDAAMRIGCMIDCCQFYWAGREKSIPLFTSAGSRASEIEGAILNVQLDRLPGMIKAMRAQKKRILNAMEDIKEFKPLKYNSLDWECGAYAGFLLPDADTANRFQAAFPCMIAGKTGRHVYTEWDPIIEKQGAPNPVLNPYNLKENKDCRMDLKRDQCPKSLEILNRAVMIATHPNRLDADTDALIEKVHAAAKQIL